MSAPSVRGRGTARVPRQTAKIIRMPTPEIVRRGQRKRLRGLLALTAVLAIIAARDHFVVSEAVDATLKPRLQPDAVETRLLRLVNEARERAGETPLTFSQPLMAAAYSHSSDMAGEGYLAYDGPAGDTPVSRITSEGVAYREVAENLYHGNAIRIIDLADLAVAQWLANPLGRSNLLGPQFRTTGIAVAHAGDGSFYITEDFVR